MDLTQQGGTIGDMIVQSINRYPDRVAFIDDRTTVTYRELGVLISKTIKTFQTLGLKRGECVAQLSKNRLEVFVLMASCYIMGLRSVTLHGMGSLSDHDYIISDADASLFVADSAYGARLNELKACNKVIRHWYSHDDHVEGQASFWNLVNEAQAEPLRNLAAPTDIVRLAYTGGTTGKPKGVMLSNRSMWMQAILLMGGRDLPEELILLCPTPISHGAGAMLVPTLWRGGKVVLQSSFNPEKYMAALEQHKATFSFLVPTMIYTLLDHPDCSKTDWSSMRMLSYGAAPMSPTKLQEAIRMFGPVMAQSYGQTESPSNILYLSKHDHVRADISTLGSAGMPYPGVTVALLNDQDEAVPDGEIGEICVRSPLVMEGYWKLPEMTAEVFRGGWLHTGDMAYKDPYGYFYLVDRKKDMIISGGFNVYPKEVENCLTEHPAVNMCAVIGVPDEKWGEAVKAVIVLKQGAVVTEDELKNHVREQKGPVSTPKTIDFIDEIPLTALGKADKKKLREKYWNNASRAIN